MAALGLAGLAALCAFAYAWRYLSQPPSPARTALKVGSVALLGLAALVEGGPLLLVGGLALSAAGDGFLAHDRLRAGVAAFGAAQLLYVLMLLLAGGGLGPGWLQAIVQFGLIVGAGVMVRWLRPTLGPMEIPVYVYAALVTLMAVLATGLPGVLWLAAVGGVAFYLSDGLLAAQMFKLGRERPDTPQTDLAIWALYWLGQALIVAGFLARPG